MNRTQFWTRYAALIGMAIAAKLIMEATASLPVSPLDAMIYGSGMVALLGMSLYCIYLRARDVGYVKAGWMTACTLIPLVGIGVFLTIAFLPTGSRIGCMLPCLPSTQKRWAQQTQRGLRIA